MTLVMGNPTEAALRALRRAGLIEVVGGDNIQATMAEAIARAKEIANPKLAASDSV